MKGSRGPSCKKVRQDALNLPELQLAKLATRHDEKKKYRLNYNFRKNEEVVRESMSSPRAGDGSGR